MTDAPTAPDSLPNYIADGLPKQNDATLLDAQEYIQELLDHRSRPVETAELPADAEPVESENDGKGTVVEERVTCGDESCACMSDGEKHGPYLYRYYRSDGSLKSEYIGKA